MTDGRFSDVTSCHAPSEFIGFLLTDIPRPTPLIKLIDEDISQRKREKWAKEVERFTDVLHDNDIVWGDAKADNFVLDENEKLWIIDFGGNYTEGWVDAEKAETMEGDEQGIEKIVNALVDPIEGTEEIRSSQEAIDQERERGEKRRVDDDEEGEEDGGKPHGRRVRFKSSAKRNEELYCTCRKPESGKMVACDGDGCPYEWYHLSCLGLNRAPENEEWLCDVCKED